MAMLSIAQVATTLARKYTSNAGFFELCSPKSYPYEISLSPPSSKFILENFVQVRQWQQSFEESPYRSYVVKTESNHRVLGPQRIVSKLKFNTSFELEDFVLSNMSAKERSVMTKDNLGLFGGPVIKRGSFNAYYALCQLVAHPCHESLDPHSPAFKERLTGIQYFMQHYARKAALLGSELIIALQFVDFLASLPATPHLYLRQFSLPHMHSKFIERNYVLLDQLLTYCLPLERQLAFFTPKPDVLMPVSEANQAEFNHEGACEDKSAVASEGVCAEKWAGECERDRECENSATYTQLTTQDTPQNLSADHDSEEADAIESHGAGKVAGQIAGAMKLVCLESCLKELGLGAEQSLDKEQSLNDLALSSEALEYVDESITNTDVADYLAKDEHYSPMQRFLLRWGFKLKPDLVRLRSLDTENIFWLDPKQGLDSYTARSSELALEIDALNAWRPQGELRHIIICENEICYLSLPPVSRSIAIWGSGYKAVILGRLALFAGIDVLYWGDLDTHGFAILNQLRVSVAQHIKQHFDSKVETGQYIGATELNMLDPYDYCLTKIRSILMDVVTIEANLSYAVSEARPFAGRLKCLTTNERHAYRGLLNQLYGQNLRIEQEFIPFDQLINALKLALPEEHITEPENYY